MKITLFTKNNFKDILLENQIEYLKAKLSTILPMGKYFVVDMSWFRKDLPIGSVFNLLKYKSRKAVYTTFYGNRSYRFKLTLVKEDKAHIIMLDKIYFLRTSDKAIIPIRERGNAGFDVWTCEDNIKIEPHTTKLINTGLKPYIPNSNYYLQVADRGSMGSLGITYTAGIIDNNYRGEIFISLCNTTNKTVHISSEYSSVKVFDDIIQLPKSKAIAQLIVQKYHKKVSSQEISEYMYDIIPTTDRGERKLGSTDANV